MFIEVYAEMKLGWGMLLLTALLLTQSGCRVVRAIDKRECHQDRKSVV